jgi:predicted ATPase/DNA-binding SARP family transcriptional activator
MAATFQLRFLGTVEITRDGKPLRGFESRKSVALLAYLAARGQAVSRSLLASLLWGDKAEAQGRSNLSRVLHNLTSLLPHCLQTDPHTVEFQRPANVWLDLAAFDEFASQATHAALAQAVELYRDEFLADIFLDDCPDFEIWLVGERERWRQRVSDALQALVAYHSRHAGFDAALRFASRLLALEPWREEAHREMMMLLAKTGQRTAALLQYEACRRVLAEQLNVEPSTEITALYERIRRGDVEVEAEPLRVTLATRAPTTPLRNLPSSLTSFIGREKEITELMERLGSPACRLLTLIGPAGIGKTRLAVEALARLDSFPDGIYFVPLAAVDSPEFLVSAMAAALEFSPQGMPDAKTQILDYLSQKQLVLALDSFEHLLRDTDLIVEILQKAPKVKILVTSQERLNLRAEWLFNLEGLEFPRIGETAPPERFAAVRLFLERAASVDPHFSPAQQPGADVVRICQLVEGMPLGLELAAAWVDKFPCRYIGQEIERSLDFLTASWRDAPARHRSLRAAIDWSYSLLTDLQRALLRRLSVCEGGISLPAAEEICRFEGLPLNMLSELSALADKSLLRAHAASNGTPRFAIPQPIREYARERLVESGESEEIRSRHSSFFLALAQAAEPQLTSGERGAGLERIELEYDNLRAALTWSLASPGRGETALRLAAALNWYWYFRGYLNEGRDWVKRILEKGSHLPPSSALATVLYSAGAGAWLQGDYSAAKASLDASVDLARALGDKRALAFSLAVDGLVAMNLGDAEGASTRHRESGALFTEIGDKWGLALSLTNMQLSLSTQGDDEGGRSAVERAVALFRELDDPWGLALALNNLGLLAYRQGEFASARARVEEALAIRRGVGDKWLIAQSLNYLGNVVQAQCDYPTARHALEESLQLNRELGNKHGIAESFEGLARLAAAQHQPQRAAQLWGSAQALRAALGSPLPLEGRAEYDRMVDTLRAALGEGGLAAALADGHGNSVEQAIEYALQSG